MKRLYLVFLPDKLQKASNSTLLTGQIPDTSYMTEILGEIEEDVDKILDLQIYYRKL
jgi:hypothetical protein